MTKYALHGNAFNPNTTTLPDPNTIALPVPRRSTQKPTSYHIKTSQLPFLPLKNNTILSAKNAVVLNTIAPPATEKQRNRTSCQRGFNPIALPATYISCFWSFCSEGLVLHRYSLDICVWKTTVQRPPCCFKALWRGWIIFNERQKGRYKYFFINSLDIFVWK